MKGAGWRCYTTVQHISHLEKKNMIYMSVPVLTAAQGAIVCPAQEIAFMHVQQY